jgi:hypothetical protein
MPGQVIELTVTHDRDGRCCPMRQQRRPPAPAPACHPAAVLDYLGGSPKRLDVGFVPSPSGGQVHSWQEEEVHSAAMWSKQESK